MCALFSTLFPQNMQENKMLESKSQVLQGYSSAFGGALQNVQRDQTAYHSVAHCLVSASCEVIRDEVSFIA